MKKALDDVDVSPQDFLRNLMRNPGDPDKPRDCAVRRRWEQDALELEELLHSGTKDVSNIKLDAVYSQEQLFRDQHKVEFIRTEVSH